MDARRVLPALLLLFVGSGCAALIYEVVWFQLLKLVIGSSAVSIGVLLGTFMGGMCLGSLLLPRIIPASRHPLRVYAWLELGIGALGLLILLAMPLVGGAYTAWAGGGVAGIAFRGIAAAICLLPPTLLMGATLPAIARWVERTPDGVAWLGFFYGGNTGGAVLGSLLGGFYLLSYYDVSVATYVGATLNVVVALLAFAIAAVTPNAAILTASPTPIVRASGTRTVYVVIALSGLTALACEVIWTRLLSLLLGATVYTFSLILAVFLAGLGLGSSFGSGFGRRLTRPAVALGWCQLLLCAAMAWSAWALTQSLPFWPINPSLATSAWNQFQLDLLRSVFAVLPGAILWGASFPLALAAVATRNGDPARLVGGVYAANTLGAIVGSLSAGLVLVVLFGTQRSQQILIVVAAVSGLLLLVEAKISAVALTAASAVAGILTFSVQPLPGIFVAYGRYTATQMGQAEVIYVGEGWNASVAVSERSDGARNYHNAGKVQASSEPQDMRLQRMLGHLTTLVPVSAKKVVVIGCGAGVTAGAVSIDPVVEHETIAEIEPLVPQVVSKYFADYNFNVVANPKVRVHIDDARHFLSTTAEKFDAITSDPLDPWVKGAAMLYTREFFELAKSRLNPGGIVTLFVQLYESNTEAVKSEVATFFEAFPLGMIFANTYNGAGYDLVLLGQVGGTAVNLDEMEARLLKPEYASVRLSLSEVGLNSVVDLFGTYAGSAADFKDWTHDAQINRDRNLRLQYLAGRGLNLYRADAIFAEMLPFAKDPPAGVFEGSERLKTALLQKIRAFHGR